MCFSACYLQKTRKWMPCTLYWESKGHYENLYNESFIVSQDPQGKKRKNLCLWRSFLNTKILKVMNNTLNWETGQHYQMRVF